MEKESREKNKTLTDEQAQRAAETLLNAWLRSDDSTTHSTQNSKNINKK